MTKPTTPRSTPTWVDATTYSRGQADRTPTTWRMTVGAFSLVVTCTHIFYPGQWIMHLHPVLKDHQLAQAKTLAEAQASALKIARRILERGLQDIEVALADKKAC